MSEVTISELTLLQEGMSENQRMMFTTQYNAVKKDRGVSLILSILGGTLGIDRFYVGDTALGIVKLLTFGFFGLFWLVDLFLIMGVTDKKNRDKAYEIAASIKLLAA